MISFSKITKDAFENMVKADFVVDRIYFVEGLGTFITDTTTTLGYKKYDYDFSTEFAAKADRVSDPSTVSGQVAKIDADGDAVGTGYTIGVTSKTGFGADNKLATEKGVESFVNDAINTAADGAISGITFNNANAQIGYTPIGGNSTPVSETLSGLVRNFTYDDGKITLTASNGFEKTINLPAEQFLKDVKTYTVPSAGVTADVTGVFTEAIPANTFTGISGIPGLVFKFAVVDDPTDATSGGVEHYRYTFVSVEDLVHDFNEEQFEVTNGKLTLKSIPTSLISAYVDGNYISKFAATENTIALANGSQELKASNYQINNSAALTDSNTLVPTESVVSAFVDSKLTAGGLANKADKAPGTEGTIFTNNGIEGNLVSSLYSVGTTSANDFGAANKLATEVGAKAYVDGRDVVVSGQITGWVDDNYISKFEATSGTVALANGSDELESSSYKIGVARAQGDNPTFGGANLLATESAIADLLSFK